MPASTEDVVWLDVLPSMRKFGPELQRGVAGSTAKAGKSAGKGFTSSFKKHLKVGAVIGASLAAAAGGAFLKESVREASELGESLNAVNVTFGKNAEGIAKLGKASAETLGLSQSQFNGLAVQFSAFATSIAGDGGDVVGVMKDLTGRGADFASVMNLDVDEAMRTFQSGLAGETEPLRKYGIDLSAAAVENYALANGIIKTGETMTEAQKVQARYGSLMEQTSKVQGDFANTSDSFANVQRRLGANWDNIQATVGMKVIPTLEKFSGWVLNTGLPSIQRFGGWLKDNLGPVFKEISGGVRAFVAAFRDGSDDITSSGFAGFLERLGVASRNAFDYIRNTAIPALRNVGSWIVKNRDWLIPLVAGIVAGTVAWKAYIAVTKGIVAFKKSWAAAQASLNAVMRANPIGIVITVIAALVAILVVAYKRSETFRNIVDRAFRAVAAAGKWMWDNVLKPTFEVLKQGWSILARAIQSAWTGVIRPAWNAVSAAIRFLWNNVAKPYFNFVVNAWKALATAIRFAWTSIIKPAWGAVQTAVKFLWNNVLRPTFSGIRSGWEALSRAFRTVYNGTIKPVFDRFKSVIETVRRAFSTGVEGIRRIWANLKNTLRGPIQAVIDVVWNNGLRKLWNFVNNLWGGKDLGRVVLGGSSGNGPVTASQRRARGGVLPGYTPGRDVHSFYSPTAGALHLSGGEAVMRPEWTRVMGPANVNLLNEIARQEGEAGLRRALSNGITPENHQHFARGGIISLPGWLSTALKVIPGAGGLVDRINGANLGGGLLGSGLAGMVRTIASKMWEKAKSLFDGAEAKKAAASKVSGSGGGSGSAGGTWHSLWNYVKARVPQARINSTYRPGDPGYHGRNKAIDFGYGSGPGGLGSAGLARIDRVLYDGLGRNLAELIYDGRFNARPNIKNGRHHPYSRGTQLQHRNHVHAAVYHRGGVVPRGMGPNVPAILAPDERVWTAPQDDYFKRFVAISERASSVDTRPIHINIGGTFDLASSRDLDKAAQVIRTKLVELDRRQR